MHQRTLGHLRRVAPQHMWRESDLSPHSVLQTTIRCHPLEEC